MKQTIRIAAVLLLAVAFSLGWGLVSSSDKNEQEKARLVAKNNQLKSAIDKKESEFNDILYLMTEVEDQIKQILHFGHQVEDVRSGGSDQADRGERKPGIQPQAGRAGANQTGADHAGN